MVHGKVGRENFSAGRHRKEGKERDCRLRKRKKNGQAEKTEEVCARSETAGRLSPQMGLAEGGLRSFNFPLYWGATDKEAGGKPSSRLVIRGGSSSPSNGEDDREPSREGA